MLLWLTIIATVASLRCIKQIQNKNKKLICRGSGELQNTAHKTIDGFNWRIGNLKVRMCMKVEEIAMFFFAKGIFRKQL